MGKQLQYRADDAAALGAPKQTVGRASLFFVMLWLRTLICYPLRVFCGLGLFSGVIWLIMGSGKFSALSFALSLVCFVVRWCYDMILTRLSPTPIILGQIGA